MDGMTSRDAAVVPPARQWWTLLPFLVAVAVVLACWSAGVAAATARPVASDAPVRPDEVLAALAAGASALCLLWLAVVVAFGVLRNLPWPPFDSLAPG